MPLCGHCGKHHKTVEAVRECHRTTPKQVKSSQGSGLGSKPSTIGQVNPPPVDPEGAKRATPQFDKENREPYN